MVAPSEWNARFSLVRDVLDGALVAAENGSVYPEPELVRRATAPRP